MNIDWEQLRYFVGFVLIVAAIAALAVLTGGGGY